MLWIIWVLFNYNTSIYVYSIILYIIEYSETIIYNIYYMLFSLFRFQLNSIHIVVVLLTGVVGLVFGLKVFTSISVVVGNIIDVYIWSLIGIVANILRNYALYSMEIISSLWYYWLDSREIILFILANMEFISLLFQSITIANRLTINLTAGILLLYLFSIAINYITYYLMVEYTILFMFFIIFIYETVNSTIQLYIFSLLTNEYST